MLQALSPKVYLHATATNYNNFVCTRHLGLKKEVQKMLSFVLFLSSLSDCE